MKRAKKKRKGYSTSDPFSDNNRYDPRFFDYVPCGNITATHAEGTGALYFSTGGSSGAVCIFTARQVVLPFKDSNNKLYDRTQRQRSIEAPQSDPFRELYKSMICEIVSNCLVVESIRGSLPNCRRRRRAENRWLRGDAGEDRV
ncbi:hypothetical protein BDQ17DRAFT_901183 [Cyathus striatus]|nr:hypothetical protein BDQ17DRAFT_901183 [Cyathus striatus]